MNKTTQTKSSPNSFSKKNPPKKNNMCLASFVSCGGAQGRATNFFFQAVKDLVRQAKGSDVAHRRETEPWRWKMEQFLKGGNDVDAPWRRNAKYAHDTEGPRCAFFVVCPRRRRPDFNYFSEKATFGNLSSVKFLSQYTKATRRLKVGTHSE